MNKNDIIQLIDKGYTKSQLAEHFGVSKSTLTNKFKKYNISMANHYYHDLFTKEFLENEFFKRCKTFSEVCKEHGCSRVTLHKAINRHGINYIKNYSAVKKLENAQWLKKEYLDNNRSIKDISLELKCAEDTVSKYLAHHQIEKKPRFEEKVWMIDIPFSELSSKKTTKEISEKYPCSEEYVRQLQIRNNIDRLTGYNTSSLERKITKILDDNDVDYILNTKTLIGPMEVDIYIPEAKLAIEVNGIYYHNELHVDKNYHERKRLKCEAEGVKLMQFYEDDINNKFQIIENTILHRLNLSDRRKVFARKCNVIGNLSVTDRKLFLNVNHIQGFCKSDYHLGLEYDGELVALMLFEDDVLVRYATNSIVCGGFSKLLKKSGKSYIRTFVDYDTFTGSAYEKVGFRLVDYIKPDYKYCVKNIRKHKFNYRRDKFRNDSSLLYDEDRTEHELAIMNKIYRVYDSGKGVYEWRDQDQEKH